MSEFANTYYQRATHLSEIGRWQEAIREANFCLAIEPNHYSALCIISRCQYALNEFDKSSEYAERAIGIDPTQEWAYRLQASVYLKRKKLKKAFQFAQEAVKATPHQIYPLKTLASIQLELKKFKDAQKTAEIMRSKAPDSFETHEIMRLSSLISFVYKNSANSAVRLKNLVYKVIMHTF